MSYSLSTEIMQYAYRNTHSNTTIIYKKEVGKLPYFTLKIFHFVFQV